MEKLELKGIWKGEYVYDDKFQPSVVKTAVPFILKIKLIRDDGLFEGMCQDDPSISQIDFPADIYGKLDNGDLVFNKRYPKTIFRDNLGNIVKADEPQPDIIYQAKIPTSGKIFGTWRVERTFRKIGEMVIEIGPVTGVWWMIRL
jgi:hypothetical protein